MNSPSGILFLVAAGRQLISRGLFYLASTHLYSPPSADMLSEVGLPSEADGNFDFRKWIRAIIGKITGIMNASMSQAGTSHPLPRNKIERAARANNPMIIRKFMTCATKNGQLIWNESWTVVTTETIIEFIAEQCY